MPWCPKCKMEYQEGVAACPDCKIDLVESLEEAVILIPIVQTEDKKIADKFSRYLEYSNLKSEVSFNEENEIYVVSVDRKMEKQAKKLYKAFYYVESDNQIQAVMEELNKKKTEVSVDEEGQSSPEKDPDESGETMDDDTIYEQADTESKEEFTPEITDEEFTDTIDEDHSRAYVMKADQYKDLAGTVGIFLFFGVVGLAVVLLNVVGILTFLNGWLPNTVMGALFIFFIYVALSTNQKAKKIQSEIDAENKLTEEINQWLEANITKSYLSSIYNDAVSEELNYIKATDKIKELLIKKFGNQNLAYLDRLIEEHYSNSIDNAEE